MVLGDTMLSPFLFPVIKALQELLQEVVSKLSMVSKISIVTNSTPSIF